MIPQGKTPLMLRSFSVENYLSIKDKAEISFRLTERDAAQGWSVPSPRGDRLSTAIGIYGANASGKSSILKALSFLTWFINDSFEKIKPQEELPIFPWFETTIPTVFALECEDEQGILYNYHLAVSPKRVLEEHLFSRRNAKRARAKKVFSRIWNAQKEQYTFDCSEELSKIPQELYRPNASIISTAAQFNVRLPIFHEADSFFNITASGRVDEKDFLTHGFNLFAYKPTIQQHINNFLSQLDVGLDGLEARMRLIQNPDTHKKERQFSLWGKHFIPGRDAAYYLPFTQESGGTQAIFIHLCLFLPCLEEGGIIIMDELEAKLHPALVEFLLELFNDPEINTGRGQLIFSSHLPELINLLGKSHIYLVEKRNQQSEFYRLSDFNEARSHTDISGKYLSGKFGGVPQL